MRPDSDWVGRPELEAVGRELKPDRAGGACEAVADG